MNGFSLPIWMKSGLTAGPDLIMGLAFLVTWIEPKALGENMQIYFLMIMFLEFITIHSAAFMGWAIIAGTSKFIKILRAIGLGMFYSLFVWTFALPNNEMWALSAFWLLVLNRIMAVLFGDENTATHQAMLMANWGMSVFCYVLSIFVTVFLPIPAFGWTSEYIQHLTTSGAGLWFEDPQSMLAAGFLYFFVVGVFELYSPKITEKLSMINSKIPFRGKE